MKEKHQLLQCIFHKNRLLSVCIRFTRPVRTYKKPPKTNQQKNGILGVFLIYFNLFFYLFFCDTVYKGLKSAHREMSVFKLSVSLCCADDLMADQRMDISSTMTDFMSPSSTDLISSSISTPGMDYTRKRKGSTTDYQ